MAVMRALPFPRAAEHGFTPLRRSAEHGFTPLRRSAEHGFTLVEMMVVLVILGLAAAAVVLVMPEPGGSVQAEAERFAARAKAARDMAIVEARAAAIEVGGNGYVLSRRQEGEWRETARYEWIRGTKAEGGRTRFDTTGLADPLYVMLRRGDARAAIEIRSDGTIHVRR
ncbi:MAG: prepilin-type N-terminal cleavage/methylation domain-containing protein [Sphingomonas sp.]|nr:prepilin-type N-terminal cleavage/methylation domain-containing protein [Sphingomonas sp.]